MITIFLLLGRRGVRQPPHVHGAPRFNRNFGLPDLASHGLRRSSISGAVCGANGGFVPIGALINF